MLRVTRTCLLPLALLLMAGVATATPRAWLDRDRIQLGETVTLNVEAGALSDAPDYAPLEADFDVSGHSSRRSYVSGSQGTRTTALFAVALRPLRDGVLTIPALQVGQGRTMPLNLVVSPASDPGPGAARGDVFIESTPDDTSPYVQQSVGWVVRLFSAVPIVSGALDQPVPEGASLQRVGDDAQYSRTIDGRQYQVVERRFMLVPERSGALQVPAATFEGRGTAGLFDDMFGSGRGSRLSARARGRTLDVQAIPAAAPQPWLPLHDLELRYRANPERLMQGETATLTVEAVADGATGAQMPELVLPPIDGLQVFPEKAQVDERFVDGRPQATVTRSFSLVPAREGEIHMPGVGMRWWDVAAGEAREARTPPLEWVAEAGGSAARERPGPAPLAGAGDVSPDGSASPPPGNMQVSTAMPGAGGERHWMFAALGFAVLWLLTLLWAVHGRQQGERTAPAMPTHDSHRRRPDPALLEKALDTGSLDDVAEALRAAAPGPTGTLDDVRARLDDPLQRDAVDALQRARWSDGDGSEARRLLRDAFAGGARWMVAEGPGADTGVLPPLYPPSRQG